GFRNGMVTYLNFSNTFAPSISADSYNSFGTFCNPAKKYKMFTPIQRQVQSKTINSIPDQPLYVHATDSNPKKLRIWFATAVSVPPTISLNTITATTVEVRAGTNSEALNSVLNLVNLESNKTANIIGKIVKMVTVKITYMVVLVSAL